jgi:2-dehydro-3-deoxy-D-gluconate 5-dehydrogenase
MMSLFGASFAPAYAASKGGIVQFTRACACAWAPDNIQANAILPGWIDTDLTKRARVEVSGLHERVLVVRFQHSHPIAASTLRMLESKDH